MGNSHKHNNLQNNFCDSSRTPFTNYALHSNNHSNQQPTQWPSSHATSTPPPTTPPSLLSSASLTHLTATAVKTPTMAASLLALARSSLPSRPSLTFARLLRRTSSTANSPA